MTPTPSFSPVVESPGAYPEASPDLTAPPGFGATICPTFRQGADLMNAEVQAGDAAKGFKVNALPLHLESNLAFKYHEDGIAADMHHG